MYGKSIEDLKFKISKDSNRILKEWMLLSCVVVYSAILQLVFLLRQTCFKTLAVGVENMNAPFSWNDRQYRLFL